VPDARAGGDLFTWLCDNVMSNTTAPITDLYAPVRQQLGTVRQLMDNELASDLPAVRQLCAHAQAYHGKMLRPVLVLLTADALDRTTDAHCVIAAVVELVHLATLVHDDVLDEADTRRGQPTINQLAGNESAVMLGDYLISHAFHLCAGLDDQHASRRIGATTNTVCEGELLQLHHRGDLSLDEPTYIDIIRRKTAALTAVCGELGARFAGADSDMTAAMAVYGEHAGIAFQIMDDVLDLVGSENDMGKTLGRDAELAKLTLPMIHCLATRPASATDHVRGMLGGTTPPDRSLLAKLLRDAGSIDYARSIARDHTRTALEQLRLLPESPARSSLVAMTEFIVDRNH